MAASVQKLTRRLNVSMRAVKGTGATMVANPVPAETMPRARARRSWNQRLMSREAGIIPAQL